MTLKDLLEKSLGIKTQMRINPEVASVGTAAVKIFSNNPNRVASKIVNLSANTVYIGFANDVSSSKGVLLGPNGGSASLQWNEDFDTTGYELWAIASGAASAIYCHEVTTA